MSEQILVDTCPNELPAVVGRSRSGHDNKSEASDLRSATKDGDGGIVCYEGADERFVVNASCCVEGLCVRHLETGSRGVACLPDDTSSSFLQVFIEFHDSLNRRISCELYT